MAVGPDSVPPVSLVVTAFRVGQAIREYYGTVASTGPPSLARPACRCFGHVT